MKYFSGLFAEKDPDKFKWFQFSVFQMAPLFLYQGLSRSPAHSFCYSFAHAFVATGITEI